MNYAFYRFLGLLVAGILCARFLDISLEFVTIGLALAALSAILIALLIKVSRIQKLLFGFGSLTFFFFLGAFILLEKERLSEDHFVNAGVLGEQHLVEFKLIDQLNPNEYNTRFYADVLAIDGIKSTGKILVLFKRVDSVEYELGQKLTVYDDINKASDARNPGDFNYKKYLESIDVYGQLYVDRSSIFKVSKTDRDRTSFLDRLKVTMLNKLDNSGLEKAPKSIIEALVLGQRQNVDPEITKSFRDAGVIHILALSGLHVGIILLILQFLTRPMLRLPSGRWFQSILIIVFLWCFAILTGMSPSIMRAVTMFSFVAVGMNIKRKASTFHSLTLSALFLLLFDPVCFPISNLLLSAST